MDEKILARLPNDKDATRFWWVRHAWVPEHGTTMYGSLDVDCDCSDTALFEGVAARLPENAIWYHSPLKRTRQTADALINAGAKPKDLIEDKRIIEMDFGNLNGRELSELIAERDDPFTGFFPTSPFIKPPNGESFTELCERIAEFTDSMHQQHRGKDVVCVAHRGVILAVLANALELPLQTSVSLKIDNVSLSRLWQYDNLSADGPQFKLGEVGWLP